ncbi:MAG: excalibur calcium-binding domain-containing protein [Chloroflexota bacterium]|nr:excalibur calcium-binding domain-containing protein [Chloroflexota bacterium]
MAIPTDGLAVAGSDRAALPRPPSPAAVAAPARPELVDAAYGPHEAHPGATLTLTYGVNNPETEALEVVLGGAVRHEGGDWLADPDGERLVHVPPGRSTHTRHFRMPPDADVGAYHIRVTLLSADRQVTYAERTDPTSLTIGPDDAPGALDVPVPPDASDEAPPTLAPSSAPATPTAVPTVPPPPAPPTSTPLPPMATPAPPTPSLEPSAPQPAPPRSATTPVPRPPDTGEPRRQSARDGRYNCSDFPSQAAAQAVLRADPSDPHHLDADRDGIACEKNPPPRDTRRVPR